MMGRPRKSKARVTQVWQKGDKNYSSPERLNYRNDVLRRDGKQCQMCPANTNLKVYPIRDPVKIPSLKHVVSNAITLCKNCCDKVKQNPDGFIGILTRLVQKSEEKNGKT